MASVFLSFTFICALIIVILGLKDIHSNERIDFTEKAMWLIAFIFLTLIAGIAYFPTYRKRNE